MAHPSQYLIGIDVGGTCTDCVVIDGEGETTLAKVYSTPPDFSKGIIAALEAAAAEIGLEMRGLLGSTRLFLHSTTMVENAIVDGDLGRVGLITTHGFEDTLFATRAAFGRWSGLTEEQKRNPIETSKPPPLVSIRNIRGVRERVDRGGNVVVPADEADVDGAVSQLLDLDVTAIGICLLWSFANPTHELMIREAVRRLSDDIFVTSSHELAPIVGEYERTSSVALNASLGPVARRYLSNLTDRLAAHGFAGNVLVMQAHGGLLSLDRALQRPIGMIESGPISGLIGSKRLGDLMGVKNIISADMGGTTFKVGVVRDGFIDYQHESLALRYHYALPKMDIVSLGLAGGSVISFDKRTGTPRIGPRSAGSYPGPIAYGHGGTEPTITDVDALLGFLNPRYFLGGSETLDVDAARQAFQDQVAAPLKLDVQHAASGLYKLANKYIYDLLHRTTVQRGLDPRSFVLFSTGGTAGMHLPAVAEELGAHSMVIPYTASVHGAFGLVTSDVVHEELVARPMRHPANPVAVDEILQELGRKVLHELEEEGFSGKAVQLTRSVDMHYRRQVHEVTVPIDAKGPVTDEVIERLVDDFESLYRQRYGEASTYRGAGVEFVTFRVRGTGSVQKPDPKQWALGSESSDEALVEQREVYLPAEERLVQVPGHDFGRLAIGAEVNGPALIWSPITTVVLNRGQTARIDGYRNINIELAGEAA